ncbi:MAG: hypothetical protein JNN32_09075 [Flavobacteriales bacterium]|nr:hypothetical protein [Flavobacteriales bacterium]
MYRFNTNIAQVYWISLTCLTIGSCEPRSDNSASADSAKVETLEANMQPVRYNIRDLLRGILTQSVHPSSNIMIQKILQCDSLYYYVAQSSFDAEVADGNAVRIFDLEKAFDSKKPCLVVLSILDESVSTYTLKIVLPDYVSPNNFIKGGIGWHVVTNKDLIVNKVTEIEI